MTEKRFLLEDSDYDLKYEFRIADLSRVKKTKEDFLNEEEETYNYYEEGGYLDYLYDNNAFLTQEEADKVLNELHEENQQLKELLHESLSSLIWEWSSEIDKDLKELNKVMNTGDIDEITKFVRNE